MQKLRRITQVDVLAVALISALAAMPAFAQIPVEIPFVGKGLPLRNWILVGSLVLLAVALALRLMRHRGTRDAMPEGPDLRWWRNP